MNNLLDNIYKPDVLSCLSDLSNDEVFTPPIIANKMLDLLPKELWQNPNIKILDPAVKSGVFLREAAKRFIEGEKEVYPDLLERINHIMHEQLFGIACTELTALMSRRTLYCSKYPNGPYSICKFSNAEGNIRFKRINHIWENGKCKFCGASISQYDRSTDLEAYAYEFIHTIKAEELFNMKFDVIISNPPYQFTVGVKSETYALPIYQKFIQQAKRLNPKYITMIVPAKWYTGGRNLDDFRKELLNDESIRKIVDFPNPYDCFQGVDNPGGICYFLWDRDNKGKCEFTTSISGEENTVIRKLNQYPIFIRDAVGIKIVDKVVKNNVSNRWLSNVVSPQTPFGIITSYKPKEEGIPCWYKQRIGLKYVSKEDVKDIYKYIGKYKFLIPEAPIAGQTDFTKPVGIYYEGNTKIAKPEEICTQTYLVANAFDSLEETEFFKSYILTKTVRFLVLQAVVSQHISREKFCFVPDLGSYTQIYTDEYLRQIWNISDDEWHYIDNKIRNIGENDIEEGVE